MKYNDFDIVKDDLIVEKMNEEYSFLENKIIFDGFSDIKNSVCTLNSLEIKAKIQQIENCISHSNDYLEFYRLKNYRKQNFDIPATIEQNRCHQDFFCNDNHKFDRKPCPCPCSPKEFIGNELCILGDLLNLFCLPNCNLNRNCLKDIIVIRFDNLKNFIG